MTAGCHTFNQRTEKLGNLSRATHSWKAVEQMSEMDDLTPTPRQGPVLPDYRSKGANPQNARAGYSNGGLTQRIPAAAAAMSRWASASALPPFTRGQGLQDQINAFICLSQIIM